jgi:type IV pilus assembly protein PilY1
MDTDRDGKIDYVYAGDINGNLWKFDLRTIGSPPSHEALHDEPGAADHRPAGGVAASRTAATWSTSRPAGCSRAPTRPIATTVYYAYGIRDNGTTIADANIVSQTLTAKTWTARRLQLRVRVSSSNAVDYGATTPKQGWKLALPAGERVVGDGGLVTNSRLRLRVDQSDGAHAADRRRRAAAGRQLAERNRLH